MKYLFVLLCAVSTGVCYAQYVREDDTTQQTIPPAPKEVISQPAVVPTPKTAKEGFKHFAGIYLGNSSAFGSIVNTNINDPHAGFAHPGGATVGLAHINFRVHKHFGLGGIYSSNVYRFNTERYALAFLSSRGYTHSGWTINSDDDFSWGSVHLLAGPTGYIPIRRKIILIPKIFWGISRIVSPKIAFNASRQNTDISYSQRPFASNTGRALNIGATCMYVFSKRFAATGTLDFFYTTATFNKWEATVQTRTQGNSSVETEKYKIPERTMEIMAANITVGIVYMFGKENWDVHPLQLRSARRF